MRTISTDGLKPLGPEGRGPWLLDDKHLLRTSSGGEPLRTEAAARTVLDSYRTAKLAGADSPSPVEVVRTDRGYGAVVEYVQGLGIGLHLMIGSFTPDEAGREMGAILHRLHAFRTEGGRDWNGRFRRWALALSDLLPREVGERLSSLVCAIPASSSLLHGDLNLGNVIVYGGHLALIDMESVGFGHPVFDLAIARSRMFFNAPNEAKRIGIVDERGKKVIHSMWDALLESYFEDASASELAEIDRRLTVLAEVENCCLRHGMGYAGTCGLSDGQRKWLALCSRRLEALMPRIHRLDFL